MKIFTTNSKKMIFQEKVSSTPNYFSTDNAEEKVKWLEFLQNQGVPLVRRMHRANYIPDFLKNDKKILETILQRLVEEKAGIDVIAAINPTIAQQLDQEWLAHMAWINNISNDIRTYLICPSNIKKKIDNIVFPIVEKHLLEYFSKLLEEMEKMNRKEIAPYMSTALWDVLKENKNSSFILSSIYEEVLNLKTLPHSPEFIRGVRQV